MSGTLFVVATPLGNLDDLSPRARDVLGSVDAIACEDTRRTARLLARFGIETSTVSCHKFNERSRCEPLLDRLRRGRDVALVSDGGTPAVADPGALLVRAALDENLRVSPVPGPSAVSAMLSASGMPADRYVFDGFLPHRGGQRRRRLRELRSDPRTLVLYEAPSRVLDTLRDLDEVFGERRVVVGRELTKLHETVLAGTAAQIAGRLGEQPVRGELTLVIAGHDGRSGTDDEAERVRRAWRSALAQSEGDRRRALRKAARDLGCGRAELQRRLHELGEPGEDRG